jgi:cytochrome c biogenesis protein CcdA
MVEVILPTLTTIVFTALIDSINPCAIGVLILLLSTLLVTKKKEKMLKIGVLYIVSVYITYLVLGFGVLAFLAQIPLSVAEYISIFVGILVVIGGLLEIKDYFWYGQGVSLHIPSKYAKKIKEKMQNVSIGTVIFLGAFVAAVELPCTGGPYLAILLILKESFDTTALFMLLLYNIIFVMPLIIILVLAYFGVKLQNIQNWKQSNKAYMRLATGLIMIGLGWLLMLIANGTINLN